MARRGKGKGRAASPARGRRGRSSTQQTRASPSSSRNDAGNTPGRPASAEPEEYISAKEIVMLAASPQKKQKYVRWTEYEDGVFLRALSIYRKRKGNNYETDYEGIQNDPNFDCLSRFTREQLREKTKRIDKVAKQQQNNPLANVTSGAVGRPRGKECRHWTEDEQAALIQGYNRHKVSAKKWVRTLNDPDLGPRLERFNSTDLKEKWMSMKKAQQRISKRKRIDPDVSQNVYREAADEAQNIPEDIEQLTIRVRRYNNLNTLQEFHIAPFVSVDILMLMAGKKAFGDEAFAEAWDDNIPIKFYLQREGDNKIFQAGEAAVSVWNAGVRHLDEFYIAPIDE